MYFHRNPEAHFISVVQQSLPVMRHKENFLLQNVGGENLLVPLGAEVMDINGIITLNETAAYIWSILDNDCSENDLAMAVSSQFSVNHEQALIDIRQFVDILETKGLLLA